MNTAAPSQSVLPPYQAAGQSTRPAAKRRKLSLCVSVEVGSDEHIPIHEVFPDGTFTPANDSHFERTSAAASAFVARTLAAPPLPPRLPNRPFTSVHTSAPESDNSVQWPTTTFTQLEGSIWELGRSLIVIDALRSETPLLRLTHTATRARSKETVSRDGAALLMAKRRSMIKCADDISVRVGALAKWLLSDNDFCDSFLSLRRRCHGVRRASDGTPLIDVGDSDFVAVRRPPDMHPHSDVYGEAPVSYDEPRTPKTCVIINYPAPIFLKFSVRSIEDAINTNSAPVIHDIVSPRDDHPVTAVIRRIRMARVSSFRRSTFELLAKQATSLPHVTDMSATHVTVDSGPCDLLSIEYTYNAQSAASFSINLTRMSPLEVSHVQLASILQIIAIQGALKHQSSQEPTTSHATFSGRPLLDKLLNVATTQTLLLSLEHVLDSAVRSLCVRLEWTRGTIQVEETRVRVYSTSTDGDGEERLLATIEPVFGLNNSGQSRHNGHVRVIPAFGVVMPAPNDPSVRGRLIMTHTTSSSSGGLGMGLDDVPRAYVCPVGGEILSALTLLLCIRLLDSLESIARAGVGHILDVDRQCFAVIVSLPSHGDLLMAKVWPHGENVGEEVPSVQIWLNGHRLKTLPQTHGDRVREWKELLRKMVVDITTKTKRTSGIPCGRVDSSASNTDALGLSSKIMQGGDPEGGLDASHPVHNGHPHGDVELPPPTFPSQYSAFPNDGAVSNGLHTAGFY